jgi:hypothetical protein
LSKLGGVGKLIQRSIKSYHKVSLILMFTRSKWAANGRLKSWTKIKAIIQKKTLDCFIEDFNEDFIPANQIIQQSNIFILLFTLFKLGFYLIVIFPLLF